MSRRPQGPSVDVAALYRLLGELSAKVDTLTTRLTEDRQIMGARLDGMNDKVNALGDRVDDLEQHRDRVGVFASVAKALWAIFAAIVATVGAALFRNQLGA